MRYRDFKMYPMAFSAIASSMAFRMMPLMPSKSAAPAMPVNPREMSGGLMKYAVTPPVPGCSPMYGRSRRTSSP